MKNKAGKFIAPTLASTSAAGEGLKIPADLRFSAINSPNPKAYPIASATFMLVYKDMCKAGKSKDTAQRVVNWLDYALGAGQDVAKELQYAPLPAAILTKAQAKVDGLQCNGQPLRRPPLGTGWSRLRSGATTAAARLSGGRRLRGLPDRALKWGLAGLAAGDPRPDRLLLRAPLHRGAAGVREVRLLRLHVHEQLGRAGRPVRRAAAAGRHPDHVGASRS